MTISCNATDLAIRCIDFAFRAAIGNRRVISVSDNTTNTFCAGNGTRRHDIFNFGALGDVTEQSEISIGINIQLDFFVVAVEVAHEVVAVIADRGGQFGGFTAGREVFVKSIIVRLGYFAAIDLRRKGFQSLVVADDIRSGGTSVTFRVKKRLIVECYLRKERVGIFSVATISPRRIPGSRNTIEIDIFITACFSVFRFNQKIAAGVFERCGKCDLHRVL